MSKQKYSPGPWKENKQGNCVYDRDDCFVVSLNDVFSGNERLILEAPQLLETLKRVFALGHARPEAWIKSLLPEIENRIERASGRK